MAWTADHIPDLSGKVAVVTGANGGLGLETTRQLARAGANVVMAARNQEKASIARSDVEETVPEAILEVVALDLGSLVSVASAANAILERHDRIEILVNNAGLMAMPERATNDGFEMQLGVNHLGHWALTSQLMPAVINGGGRVVTVSSTARHWGRGLNPTNPHLHGNYGPWKAYGQAKLANYHFAIGLQREFERRAIPVASLAAHPGMSHTDLQVHSVAEGGAGAQGPFFAWMARTSGMSPGDGALPQLRAATDPEAKGGELYAPKWGNFGTPVRRPVLRAGQRAIDTLWDVSRDLTGVRLFLD